MDDRVHHGGEADAAEFLIATYQGADLVRQDAGNASFLDDADQPHQEIKGSLFGPHAETGGDGVEDQVVRLEAV
ncbi:MAG: hypothetical protein AAB363_02400, partial [Planctomycetota bacterium]